MRAAGARGATAEIKALRRQLQRVLEDDVEPDDHVESSTVRAYDEALRDARRAAG